MPSHGAFRFGGRMVVSMESSASCWRAQGGECQLANRSASVSTVPQARPKIARNRERNEINCRQLDGTPVTAKGKRDRPG